MDFFSTFRSHSKMFKVKVFCFNHQKCLLESIKAVLFSRCSKVRSLSLEIADVKRSFGDMLRCRFGTSTIAKSSALSSEACLFVSIVFFDRPGDCTALHLLRLMIHEEIVYPLALRPLVFLIMILKDR